MNLVKKHITFCCFLLLINNYSQAQTASDKNGSWLMLFNQTRLSDKWSIHLEAQYRDYGVLKETEQLLLRTGINYHFNPSLLFSAGYGNVYNYIEENTLFETPSVSENRLWEQIILRNTIGRTYIEHRYRIEQRWLDLANENRYYNRIRYLLRVSVPINKKTIEKNTLFATFYDEIFIQFTKAPFDRNRLYGALGYQFSSNSNVQLGYLAQTTRVTTKFYFQAALFYNIDLRKKNADK